MLKGWKFILPLLLVWGLAACGNSGQTEETSGGTPAASAATGASLAVSATGTGGERSVKHAMGTTVLKKKPERVVILFNGMTDNAVALGVKPVGAVESWEEKPWYLFMRDKMDGVKNLGEETQPNIEAIVALKPDLIIGAKSRHEKIYPQLSGIAPTVMTENVFDWKNNLKLGSEAMYMDQEAGKLLEQWDKRVAEFKQKAGKLGATEISIIRFESDGSARMYITGFAGTILQELGLTRPKAQQVEGKTVINLTSKEQMPQLDGDYIFDITRFKEGDDSNKQTHSSWTTHPLWGTLKGVKGNHYYPVDVVTWNLSAGALAANSMLDDLSKYLGIR